MDGDDVLNVMGNPDKMTTMAFVFDPPRGWYWSYNIYKKFERAPDDTDKHIEIYFDVNGRVKEVEAKNVK